MRSLVFAVVFAAAAADVMVNCDGTNNPCTTNMRCDSNKCFYQCVSPGTCSGWGNRGTYNSSCKHYELRAGVQGVALSLDCDLICSLVGAFADQESCTKYCECASSHTSIDPVDYYGLYLDDAVHTGEFKCNADRTCIDSNVYCGAERCISSCNGLESCKGLLFQGGNDTQYLEHACNGINSCEDALFLFGGSAGVELNCNNVGSCTDAVVECSHGQNCLVNCKNKDTCNGLTLRCPDVLASGQTCSIVCTHGDACKSINTTGTVNGRSSNNRPVASSSGRWSCNAQKCMYQCPDGSCNGWGSRSSPTNCSNYVFRASIYATTLTFQCNDICVGPLANLLECSRFCVCEGNTDPFVPADYYGFYIDDSVDVGEFKCGHSSCQETNAYCGARRCISSCNGDRSCNKMYYAAGNSTTSFLTHACNGIDSCNDATFDFSGTTGQTTELNCNNVGSCKGAEVICPSEGSCDVSCNYRDTCKDLTVRCPNSLAHGHHCTVHCTGSLCNDVRVFGDVTCNGCRNMGSNPVPAPVAVHRQCDGKNCNIHCNADFSCSSDLSCGDASDNCNINCNGYGTCNNGTMQCNSNKCMISCNQPDSCWDMGTRQQATTCGNYVFKVGQILHTDCNTICTGFLADVTLCTQFCECEGGGSTVDPATYYGLHLGSDVHTGEYKCQGDRTCRQSNVYCEAERCISSCNGHETCLGLHYTGAARSTMEHACNGINSCVTAAFNWGLSSGAQLNCNNVGSCVDSVVTCPFDDSCDVYCKNAGTCNGMVLQCPDTLPAGKHCRLHCEGENSCQGMNVTGSVERTCQGPGSCSDAGSCNAWVPLDLTVINYPQCSQICAVPDWMFRPECTVGARQLCGCDWNPPQPAPVPAGYSRDLVDVVRFFLEALLNSFDPALFLSALQAALQAGGMQVDPQLQWVCPQSACNGGCPVAEAEKLLRGCINVLQGVVLGSRASLLQVVGEKAVVEIVVRNEEQGAQVVQASSSEELGQFGVIGTETGKSEAVVKEDESEKSDDDKWLIPVIVVSAVAVIALTAMVIFLMLKRKPANRELHGESKAPDSVV